MADKNAKKKLGDYIEISLPAYGKDQTARIWRDDVRNDAQWEHIKQEAASSGTLVSSGKSDAKAFDSGETLDLTDPITGATAKMPRGNLSEARWEALKKRDPSKNQIYWDIQKDTIEASPTSIKRTVISPDGSQEVSYQAAPKRLPEADAPGGKPIPASNARGFTVGASEFVPLGAGVTLSVDEGLDTERPVQKPMLTNPSTRTLSVDEQASAGGTLGGKLRGVLGDMAQGALPGGVPDAGGPATPTLPASDGGVALPPGAPDAGAAPSAMAGGVPMPGTAAPDAGMGSPPAEPSGPMPDKRLPEADAPGAVDMTGLPPGQGQEPQQPLDMTGIPAGTGTDPLQAAGQIASEVPARVKQFGQFLSDRPQEAQPGQPIAADGTRLGDPLDPGQPVPGAPPAPAPVPGSTSLKTQQTSTVRAPGSGGSSLEGDLNRSFKDAVTAKAEMARMEAEQSGKIAEAEIVKQKNLQNIEDARAVRAQTLVERQDKVQAAQMRAIESLSEQVKIDPSRLWSNRTAQQKADARLAGFLFGFSGSGAQYVQSLQNEVDKDVQAQLQAAQLTMEGKKAQVAGLGNIFTQLRQQGLDTNEAANVARASLLEIHNSKLAEMEARFKGTTAGVRAAEAIAALGPVRVKAISDTRTAAAQQANLYSTMRMNELETQTKAATALMKGKEETPMQATLSKEMAGLEDVRASLLNMKSMAGGGFIERARTEAAGKLPFGGIVDPNRKSKGRTFKGEAYAAMLEKAKGALQGPEITALSQIVPQEIDAFEDPEPYFQRAIAFVEQQIARRQERYSRSSPDVRGQSAGGQGGAR